MLLSYALDQWSIFVQSSDADKRCLFVVELMRGIEEPSKDLETLKHILKALQLKGLLHSKNAKNQMSHQNFIYDQNGKVFNRCNEASKVSDEPH